MRRPNVLLVVLDTARRDALEPYGAEVGSSPAIAELAQRGNALPDVYSAGCWTAPSHGSIFTGLMPRAAGMSKPSSFSEAKATLAAQSERLLPAVLSRNGYSTGAVSSNLWVSEHTGFHVGFDEIVSVDTGRHAALGGSLPNRLRWLTEAALGRADDGGRGVEETLGRWIARGPQKPFFWFVNLMECHSPYLPPRSAGRVSLADRLRAADDARRYYTLDAICRACLGGFDVPDATIERMRRLYAISIRYMDEVLGRTLERLDGAGLLDDTLVLVTADHGENFGEGGMLAHTLSLDDRLIHVPLVAAGPGAGDVDIRSLADLPRLLAEVAGIDEHPWHDLPRGMGLAQFDPPAEPDDPTVPGHIERWGLGDEAFERFTTPLSCAVANGLKLLRRGDRDELYDLSADPLELSPMPVSAPPRGREGELAALQAALDHPAMTATLQASATPSPDPDQPDEEEAREIERRMKMLGYM